MVDLHRGDGARPRLLVAHHPALPARRRREPGPRVGAVVALPIVTGIIALLHWHAVFVVIGALGVVWALVWWRIYRDPRQHPKANAEEIAYLEEGGARTAETDEADAQKIPWRSLFRYRTVLSMMFGFFCLNSVITRWLDRRPAGRPRDPAGRAALPGTQDRDRRRPVRWLADVAPSSKHVGSIGGLQNFASNFAGIITPIVVGSLVDSTGSFVVPLLLIGAIAIVGALNYLLIMGRIEPIRLVTSHAEVHSS